MYQSPNNQPVSTRYLGSSSSASTRSRGTSMGGTSLEGDPYVTIISSLLTTALNIRHEMRQYSKDWEVVMGKLEQITTLLNNFGNWCALHNLVESDLPDSLRGICQALKTELGELRRELEECKNAGYTSLMLRAAWGVDIGETVKRCDIRLSNLLQTFRVALAMDARLDQISAIKYFQERDSQTTRRLYGDPDSL